MKRSNKKSLLIILLIVSAGVLVYLNNHRKVAKSSEAPSAQTPATKITEKKEAFLKKSNTPVEALNAYPSLDEETKKSFVIFSTLAKEATMDGLAYDDFVQTLEDLGLRPTQMLNENVHTGRMNIVRTQNILPGTRYLHAQYFSEEGTNDKAYLQHISFELRPGPDSFRMAQDIIKKQFNITGAPKNSNPNYISWNVKDRVVWVKQMTAEDLKVKDPYNSYDPKTDVGTVVIAIEEEIH